jgi:hypothetical protein
LEYISQNEFDKHTHLLGCTNPFSIGLCALLKFDDVATKSKHRMSWVTFESHHQTMPVERGWGREA